MDIDVSIENISKDTAEIIELDELNEYDIGSII